MTDTEKVKEHICPQCDKTMLLFRSTFKKVCIECGKEYYWPLKEGQQPLIKSQR